MNEIQTALSLTQPWASLVVGGHKCIETRSWQTRYRGPLLIHASKGFPASARDLCETEPFRSALADMGVATWRELPTGAVLGGVTLVDCLPTSFDAFTSATTGLTANQISIEMMFGDFSGGRFGWRLREAWELASPVSCSGALSLWAVPESVASAVKAQRRPECQP